eukprot:4362231-Prymnesium_polylepis.1
MKVVCQPATKSYHVYCSLKNPGALELLEEFADNQGLTLKFAPSRHDPSRTYSGAQSDRQKRANVHTSTVYVTQDEEQICECDHARVPHGADTHR